MSPMNSIVTFRIETELKRALDEVCDRLDRTRSKVVRDALRRHLSLMRFEYTRRRIRPYAPSRGYLTDQDVFRDVS